MQVLQDVKIPILTYHSIDESGSVISTTPAVFQWQMEYLSKQGYQALTLSETIDLFSDNRPISQKIVVITFDDGFQNFYTKAFPILKRCNFRATVFLVSDFCGKYNDWKGNPPELPLSKMLSWEEIRELKNQGVEFGSHTRTHPDLTQISEEKFVNEIIESKSEIANSIGCEVKTFAYPFGKFNPAVREVVGRTFKAACSTDLGKVRTGSDYFSLERIDAFYLANPRIFRSLSTRGFDRYLAVRRLMRDVKAKVLTN